MLSSYLSSNINLMWKLNERIKKVQSNWAKYHNINECKKYSLIIDKVHEYMEQIEFDCMFDETSILYHISKKLGIADKVAKYDYISEEMYNIIMNTNKNTYTIVMTALMMALITISIMFIKIPIPFTQGYVHPGDAMIFMAVLILGWKYGAVAAAVGGALGDILGGFAAWAVSADRPAVWIVCRRGGAAAAAVCGVHLGPRQSPGIGALLWCQRGSGKGQTHQPGVPVSGGRMAHPGRAAPGMNKKCAQVLEFAENLSNLC